MDPTRGKQVAATFEEEAALTLEEMSQIQGDITGAAAPPPPPPPSAGEETAHHRRAMSDISELAGESNEDLAAMFSNLAEEPNSPAPSFLEMELDSESPGSMVAATAAPPPPSPRPSSSSPSASLPPRPPRSRHQHTYSLDHVSASLQRFQAERSLRGLPPTPPPPPPRTTYPSSLQALRLLVSSSSPPSAQRMVFGSPSTATAPYGSGRGRPERFNFGGSSSSSSPATAQPPAGLSRPGQVPERLLLGGMRPATTAGASGSGGGGEQRLPESPAMVFESTKAKAMTDAQLRELAVTHPDRAKKILDNRASAAKSKLKRVKHLADLEYKADALAKNVTTLSTSVALWQRSKDLLTAEKNQLMMNLENEQKHAQSQDAITESLQLEIQYLNMSLQMEWQNQEQQLQQLAPPDQLPQSSNQPWQPQEAEQQMPPPDLLPQSSHQPSHPQEAQQQQAQASTHGQTDVDDGAAENSGSDEETADN